MSKYSALKTFLAGSTESVVPMSFHQIEQVIGDKLPASAFTYQAWWSNNGEGHVNARAWMEAGFKSERVDLAAQKLVFRRQTPPRSALLPAAPTAGSGDSGGMGWIAKVRRSLAGTVRTAPGYDLSDPMGETWDAERS
jgi:hypothetical protein